MFNDIMVISLLVLYTITIIGLGVIAIKKHKKNKKKKPHLRIVKGSK